MMTPDMDFSVDPGVLAAVLAAVAALLIVYYYFLVRALVEMIRLAAPPVMIVFTYLAIIPVPPLLILGLLSLVIWHCVRADLPEARKPGA